MIDESHTFPTTSTAEPLRTLVFMVMAVFQSCIAGLARNRLTFGRVCVNMLLKLTIEPNV